MIIQPDFSQAVESTQGSIPPGVYKLRIEDCSLVTTQKGDPMLKWKLKIYGAEGEVAKYNNWPVYHNTMTVGKGAGMLKALYKAALGEDPTGPLDTDVLLGKEVEAVLTQGRDQQGNPTTWPSVKTVRSIIPF